MKLKVFLFILLFSVKSSFFVFAQGNRGVIGGFNTEEFPSVSFIWNTANPVALGEKAFSLEEEGIPLNITIRSIVNNSAKPVKKNILFLWEDMASHTGQSVYTKEALIGFFSEVENSENCYYNIGFFDRKKDGMPLVRLLLGDFTSDTDLLIRSIENHRSSISRYQNYPLQTDLYLSISEGIDILKKQEKGDFGAIVVITAGLNIKAAGASTEMETVRGKAVESDIPIYVLKYPIYGNTPEVNALSQSTYGFVYSTMDAQEAMSGLMRCCSSLDSRYYGRSYQVSYLSNLKMDGKPHSVVFSVDKVAQNIPLFISPSQTLLGWMKENIILSIVIGVFLGALIVLFVILMYRRRKKFNSSVKKQMQESLLRIESAEREAKRLRKEQGDFLLKQEKEKEFDKISEFQSLVQLKGIHPRLGYELDGKFYSYDVKIPLVKIGRNKDNDLILNYPEVSRYHAELRFESRGFVIYDRNSTNKVLVNGIPVQSDSILRNGDTVKIGRVYLKFFF